MLWGFGFKNFFSFKEGAEISFALDSNCPEYISRGRNYTPVLCVKGANASGKTNVLRSLSFLKIFVTASFNAKPDAPIPTLPHFSSKEPVEMFADFEINGARYFYELSFCESEIKKEVIYRTKAKKTKIVERTNNAVTFATKEFGALKAIKLRGNVSIASMANQYGLKELSDLYDFFATVDTNVSFSGINYEMESEEQAFERLLNNPEMFDFVKKFISEVDVGVTDIEIAKLQRDEKEGDGAIKYVPIFHHGPKRNRDFAVHKYTESSGTKALLMKLGRYKSVLDKGGVMIADEFDIHLHPHILPKLLNLFIDSESNSNNAQLIFTTHNSDVLNLLGKYRTYLVNKIDNESFAYRLDEVGGDILRNDRPIAPIYNDGRIGGVPKL